MIGDECIARIFALADAGQHEPVGQVHRHILERMHGDIGAAIFQCSFQFFDEQALAADLGQSDIEDLVALRGHAQYADGSFWV